MKSLLALGNVLLLVLFSASIAHGESTFHALSNLSAEGSASFAPMKDGELATIEGGIVVLAGNAPVVFLGYAASINNSNAHILQAGPTGSGKANNATVHQQGRRNVATVTQISH